MSERCVVRTRQHPPMVRFDLFLSLGEPPANSRTRDGPIFMAESSDSTPQFPRGHFQIGRTSHGIVRISLNTPSVTMRQVCTPCRHRELGLHVARIPRTAVSGPHAASHALDGPKMVRWHRSSDTSQLFRANTRSHSPPKKRHSLLLETTKHVYVQKYNPCVRTPHPAGFHTNLNSKRMPRQGCPGVADEPLHLVRVVHV